MMWTLRLFFALFVFIVVSAEKIKSKGHTSKPHNHNAHHHISKSSQKLHGVSSHGQRGIHSSMNKRFSIPNKDDEAIISNNIQSPEKITIIKKSGSLVGSELPGAYGGDEELTDVTDGSGEELISGSGRSVADIMEAARDARKKILEKKLKRKKNLLEKEDFPGLPVKELNKSDSESVLNVDSLIDDISQEKTDQKSSATIETKVAADESVTIKSSNDSLIDGNDPFSTGETKLSSSVDSKSSADSKEVTSKDTSRDENHLNEADMFGSNILPKPGINPSAAFQTGVSNPKRKEKNTSKKTQDKKTKNIVRKHNKKFSKYEISAKTIAIDTLKKGYVDFLKSQTKSNVREIKKVTTKKSSHVKVKKKTNAHNYKPATKKGSDIISQIQNIASQIDAVEKKNAEDKKLLEELQTQKKTSVENGSGDFEASGELDSDLGAEKSQSLTRNSKRHKKKVRKIVAKIQQDIDEFKLKNSKNFTDQSRLAQDNRNKLFGQQDDKVNEKKDDFLMDNDTSSISHGDNGSPDGFECPWVCFWTCHSYCPKECCHNPYDCHGICRTFCTPYCSDRCCAPGSRRLPKLEISFQTPAETGKSSNNKNKTLLEEKVEKQLKVLEENQKMVEQVEAVKQAESYAAELLGMPRDCPLFCNKICAPGLCAQDCCEKSTILSYLNHEKSLLDQALQYKKQLSMLPRPQLDALLAQQDKYLENVVQLNNQGPQMFSSFDQTNENVLHPKAAILPTPSVTRTAQAAGNYNQQTQSKPYGVSQPARPAPAQNYNHQITHEHTSSPQQQTNPPLANMVSTQTSQAQNQPPVTILIQTGSHPVAGNHAESSQLYTAENKNPYYQAPLNIPNAASLKQTSLQVGNQNSLLPAQSNSGLIPPPYAAQRAQYAQDVQLSQQSSLFPSLNLHPIEPQNYVANGKSFHQAPPLNSVKPPYPNVKAPSIANRIAQQQQQQQQQQIQKQRLFQQQRISQQQQQQHQLQMQQAFFKATVAPLNLAQQVSGNSLASFVTPAPMGFRDVSEFQANSPLNSVSTHALAPPQEYTLSQRIVNFPPSASLPAQVSHSASIAPPPPVGQLSAPAPALAPPPAPAQVPATPKRPAVIIENMKPFQIGGLLFTPEVTIADPNDPVPPGYQSTTIVPEPPAAAPASQVVTAGARVAPSAPASLIAAAAPVASALSETSATASALQVGTPFSLPNDVSSFCPTPINCPEGKTVDPDYCPPICRTSCIEQCPNECCPNYGRPVEQSK